MRRASTGSQATAISGHTAFTAFTQTTILDPPPFPSWIVQVPENTPGVHPVPRRNNKPRRSSHSGVSSNYYGSREGRTSRVRRGSGVHGSRNVRQQLAMSMRKPDLYGERNSGDSLKRSSTQPGERHSRRKSTQSSSMAQSTTLPEVE